MRLSKRGWVALGLGLVALAAVYEVVQAFVDGTLWAVGTSALVLLAVLVLWPEP